MSYIVDCEYCRLKERELAAKEREIEALMAQVERP